MSFLFSLLQFRIKQGYRVLQSLGFGIFVVFIPILFLGALALLQFLWKTPAPWGSILMLSSLVSVHYKRRDRFFLEQLITTTRPYRIYALEYSLLTGPFLVCFIYWEQWLNLTISILTVIVLTIIPPPYQQKKNNSSWQTWIPVYWIPARLWEWRSGLRQQGWWIFILYGLGFLGVTYALVTPVLTLILTITICHFHQKIAPKEIIQASNKNGCFLSHKIRLNCLFFQGILLPHYVLFLVYQWDSQTLLVLLMLMIISSCWISFRICLQYSSYTYQAEQDYNLVPFVIFVVGSLIPFFWPLLPFLWIHYWRKAQQQLNYYA